MPAKFDKCVRNKGKVRTITGPDKQFGVGKGQYRHLCLLNGETYLGYVHERKDKKK